MMSDGSCRVTCLKSCLSHQSTPIDADPAHPDPTIRERAIDDYRRMLGLDAGVNAPILGLHGAVGRIRPCASQEDEEKLLLDSAQRIAAHAATLGIRLAVEVLNRYELHLLNRSEQAVGFVERVGSPDVGVLLDTYHMRIEEPDPAMAVDAAGSRLLLFHVSDSNRRAIRAGARPIRRDLRTTVEHWLRRCGDRRIDCSDSRPVLTVRGRCRSAADTRWSSGFVGVVAEY